jgi:uncharacterized membrane protein YecN with MAPEG domain
MEMSEFANIINWWDGQVDGQDLVILRILRISLDLQLCEYPAAILDLATQLLFNRISHAECLSDVRRATRDEGIFGFTFVIVIVIVIVIVVVVVSSVTGCNHLC